MQHPLNTSPNVRTRRKLNETERKALQDTLSIFQIQCVYDHLMGVSPTIDATILTSPLQQMHSLTLESGATFNHTPKIRDESNMVSSESMMVPAYNKYGLNFGFLIAESYGLISKEFATVSDGVSTARFVARESDGTYIGIARQPLVDVLCLITTRTLACASYNFMFPSGMLAPLMRSSSNDVLAFERAMCASSVSENMLVCFKCFVSNRQVCKCGLGMTNAKSALDLSAIKQNMFRLNFGQTGGKGVYKLFGSTGASHSFHMDFDVKISSNTRPGCAKRLLNLCLEDMFKSMHIAVSRPLEPPVPLTTSLPPSNTNDYSGITRNDTEPPNFSNDSSQFILPTGTSSNPEIADDPLWPWNTISSSETAIENREILVAPHQQGNDILSVVSSTTLSKSGMPNVSAAIAQKPISRAKPIAPRALAQVAKAEHEVPKFDDEKMKETEEQVRAWRAYKRKIRNRESAARSNRARKQRLELERRRKDPSCS